MLIKRHLLFTDDGVQVPLRRSPNQSAAIKPRYLVMHYTAGASAESSISWLTNPNARASAHLVIGRDGSITQLVAFDRKAWHAGISQWRGLSGLNSHSIGIELDNVGVLTGGPGAWRTSFRRPIPDDEVVVAAHPNGGPERGWHDYTEAQLEAALAASLAIVGHYKLDDVLGHEDIAPGRKQDPGPAFPLESIRAAVLGRAEDVEPVYACTANLNIRTGPGTGNPTLPEAPLPTGTRLTVAARQGEWCDVVVLDADGHPTATGWVHGRYIRRAP
jgi:N-acetylmuramoyl-L-alanine amidase